MSLGKRCHHVVYLCFKQALSLDLSVVSSKVLSEVELERCPNKFLCIELAWVCRQVNNLERLVISLHLFAVMRRQIVDDKVDLPFDVHLIEQFFQSDHEVLPWDDIALRSKLQDRLRWKVCHGSNHGDWLVTTCVETYLQLFIREHPRLLESIFPWPYSSWRLIGKDNILVLKKQACNVLCSALSLDF